MRENKERIGAGSTEVVKTKRGIYAWLSTTQLDEWILREKKRSAYQLRLDWEIEGKLGDPHHDVSPMIHPSDIISPSLRLHPLMSTANELFGIDVPTYFFHHPSKQRIVVVPKTLVCEMEEMASQGVREPMGLYILDGSQDAPWVTMKAVEERWRFALSIEKERQRLGLDGRVSSPVGRSASRDLVLRDIEEESMGWTQNKGKSKGDSNKRGAAIAAERKKLVVAQQMRKGLVSGKGTMNKES